MRDRRHITFVASICCATTAATTALGAELALPPTIHDWSVRDYCLTGVPEVLPVPHPGWDAPVAWPVYWSLWDKLYNAGQPISFMLRDATAPITGQNSGVLLELLDALPRVDIVFADFETATTQLDEYWMVFYVRTHWNPEVSNAWIGSYKAFPGEYDESQLTPSAAYRGFLSDFYLSSGLDIAMPNCYPYDDHQVHTWPSVWGEYICPSVRYALLWAPVHKASVAKQSLPNSHLLIPWIASLVTPNNYGPVDPPPKEDNIALLQHLRLRGVDGYYTLVSNTPGYSNEQYMLDMLQTWKDLDPWFEAGSVEVLNHTTDKVGGVLWSGVSTPLGSVVLVSNFSGETITFKLPGGPWPGDGTIEVPHQGHVLATPQAEREWDPPVISGDLNADQVVDAADIGLLLAAWGPCPAAPAPCPADLNGDGVVDASDLGAMLADWTG